ncbi:aldo/keto reductase [Halomonas dongshanensis]|uniref:Aldo/keto reductase n=1 Tax=Halomonas dongshanensis TaxID=2890835 RepID=A0ABT2E8V6_9GAMM|nr:aldo/keto reductase [Halomonas dongshanensis]MCS2607991.1 aldo/keto reductase [Halomonas dongshanensis]
MQKRELGRSELHIAPLVFGGNVFGWTADEKRSFALLDRFVERGFNAVDTADVYSAWVDGHQGGESEKVLGKWLKQSGKRDDIVLMSKVGMWEQRKGLSAANIEAAVNDSLKRLQTDYLDVYFAHIDDENTPLEETLIAFSKLIEAGKVRTIGASNYSADRLRQALDVAEREGLPRYELMQPLYNLYDRDEYEGGLAEVAKANQVGVVSYFSLASGFLTGKYKSFEDAKGQARADFVEKYFDARGQRLLDTLDAVAKELSAKPAQVALAWLLARPGVTAPIASATKLEQLDDTLGAADLDLPKDAIERLNAAGR